MSSFKEKYHKLLRYGTDFFGMDLRYLVSGAAWVTTGQGLASIMAFLLTLAFANLLPKETYGLYNYLLSLSSFFNFLTLTGMNASVTQAVASGNEGALRSSVKFQLKWNALFGIAVLTLAAYYFFQANYVFAISLAILAVTSPLVAAFNTYGAFLVGKKDFKRDNLFSAISTGAYALGMFLALLVTKEVWELVLVYSAVTLATNIYFYIRTLRIYNPPETESKDVMQYGKKLTYLGFINPIVAQMDKIILNHFWGPADLAVYFLARAVPDRIYSFIKTIVSTAFPKIAQRSNEEIDKVLWKRVFQGMALGLILAAGYIIIAPSFFKYLLPKYSESVYYSQILALIFIFAAPARYLGEAFTAKKMIRPIVVTGVFANIFRIILYAILGAWGGIMGLILAELIFQSLGMIVNISLWKFSR